MTRLPAKPRITALVPLKRDSRRLPNKNFLKLAGKPLAYHIFNALMKLESVDRVCAYSSSEEFMERIPSGVEYIKRDPKLDLDSVRGLELLQAFVEQVPSDFYILAHATSPFTTTASLQLGVDGILSGEYDSALSVSEIKKYFWYDSKPINYDINDIIQTQYILPAVVETSGFYMFAKDDILKRSRRIGDRPRFVPVDIIEGIDIDDLDEFLFARRFQGLLGEAPDASITSAQQNNTRPGIAGDIRFILFELEGALAGPEGKVLEYVGQWLNILTGQGKSIGAMSRAEESWVPEILRELNINSDSVLSTGKGMADDAVADLVKQYCQNAGVSPQQTAFVSTSAQGGRMAELAGMQFFHAGWAGHPGMESGINRDVVSFESIGDAAIHFLERGK